MKRSKVQELQEKSVLDLLEQQYQNADNKEELDYWSPISSIILESIELRSAKGISQTDLAKKMNTRQSVISRFENMGRIPSYDLIARLSQALGNSPGVTLYGDYMAIVPYEKQELVRRMASIENISTKEFVQNLLDHSLAMIEEPPKLSSKSISHYFTASIDVIAENPSRERTPLSISHSTLTYENDLSKAS